MALKQPIIVLVPESFTVHVPDLPTNNGVRPPNSSYEADVAAVRETIEPPVNDGNEVFMLMHIYGGEQEAPRVLKF
ncbi:hypothetical protein AAE478_002509 [Parahypoxylon ruwenzoriense]